MLKTAIKPLRITLDVIDDKTTKVVKVETIETKPKSQKLSGRQLNFKKDDTKNLIRKMKDERFTLYKREILDILKNRFDKAMKHTTERNKKNIELVGQYYQELYDEITKHTDNLNVA